MIYVLTKLYITGKNCPRKYLLKIYNLDKKINKIKT